MKITKDLVSEAQLNDYYSLVGELTVKLQDLETLVRASLLYFNQGKLEIKEDIFSGEIGLLCEVNNITSYDSLRKLLKNYNHQILKNDEDFSKLGSSIADLRDLMAHGRKIAVETEISTTTLFKFSNDQNSINIKEKKYVVLTDRAQMNHEWLKEKISMVDQILVMVSKKLSTKGD